jgi:hypothetical protein
MDTNLVLPISPSECRVVFDWFLDSSLVVSSSSSVHLLLENLPSSYLRFYFDQLRNSTVIELAFQCT